MTFLVWHHSALSQSLLSEQCVGMGTTLKNGKKKTMRNRSHVFMPTNPLSETLVFAATSVTVIVNSPGRKRYRIELMVPVHCSPDAHVILRLDLARINSNTNLRLAVPVLNTRYYLQGYAHNLASFASVV